MSDCANGDHATVIGAGRDTSPHRIDGRVAREPYDCTQPLRGHREAVEVLGEVLHHVVALGLAVHEDVEAELLLQRR